MIRKTALFIGLSLLAGATPSLATGRWAQSGEEQLAKMIAGRIPGKPVNCISLQDIRSSRVLQGTAIVYEGRGGRLYVNRPQSGAGSLHRDDILVTNTFTSELCNMNTVRLVGWGSSFEHGFVGLGQFVPYERPKTKNSEG